MHETADDFMWDLATYLLYRGLAHRADFQQFCANVWDRLSVEQAAEEWVLSRGGC